MKLNRKFYAKFLLISIIVCLISIFGTALIDTNFGSVITKDIKIVDSLGPVSYTHLPVQAFR